MFFQSSNKLRKRTHHSGILHAGTCFHDVSLVKFIGCDRMRLLHVASCCFMLASCCFHGVFMVWVSSPKSLIKATNAAAVCTLRLEARLEVELCGKRRMQRSQFDDNDVRLKRLWTRSTALCSTVTPCSTKP